MADELFFFDEPSVRLLQRLVVQLRRQVHNVEQRLLHFQKPPPFPGREWRIGVTGTHSFHPTYPTAPADTFLVNFQDWSFSPETPGSRAIDAADWAERFEICRNVSGQYIPEGTKVLIAKQNGQWWIVHAETSDPPDLTALCADLTEYTAADLVSAPSEIAVNKAASLRLWAETADAQKALVDLGGGPTDSVFWQDAGGASPQWHRSPSVARSLQLGNAANEGFLQLKNPATPGVYHLPPPSGGDQKIRWPTTVPPGINSFLYVSAQDDDGKNLQTEWVGQGCDFEGYGSFGYDCGSLACEYVLIRKGLVIQIGDLSVQPSAGDLGTVECDITPLAPYDPCAPATQVEFVDGTGSFSFIDGTPFEFVSEA